MVKLAYQRRSVIWVRWVASPLFTRNCRLSHLWRRTCGKRKIPSSSDHMKLTIISQKGEVNILNCCSQIHRICDEETYPALSQYDFQEEELQYVCDEEHGKEWIAHDVKTVGPLYALICCMQCWVQKECVCKEPVQGYKDSLSNNAEFRAVREEGAAIPCDRGYYKSHHNEVNKHHPKYQFESSRRPQAIRQSVPDRRHCNKCKWRILEDPANQTRNGYLPVKHRHNRTKKAGSSRAHWFFVSENTRLRFSAHSIENSLPAI